MYCPYCKGTGLLQWPDFPAYERRGMGYSSPTRLDELHNPLREGTPCPTCHGSGFLDEPAHPAEGSTPSGFSPVPAHDIKEREASLARYLEQLKRLDKQIKEMEETISRWTESKNKLKKQKKKLHDLKTGRIAVKLLMEKLKD